jgi:hypothetical protein
MQNSQPNSEIVSEIYRTLVLLGAGSDLLGTVGSWGDSLSDADVLSNLTAWNAATVKELTSRIEHYETLSRRLADSPVGDQKMSLQAQ